MRVVVEWRRPGFYQTTYNLFGVIKCRRSLLAWAWSLAVIFPFTSRRRSERTKVAAAAEEAAVEAEDEEEEAVTDEAAGEVEVKEDPGDGK